MGETMRWAMDATSGRTARRIAARTTISLVTVIGLGWIGSATALASSASALRPAGAGRNAQAHTPGVTADGRVGKLISQMTLDEKLTLLEGAQEAASTNQFTAGYLPGIPRLGIPSLRLADGPPGVATREPSTGMTGTMGVAAYGRIDPPPGQSQVVALHVPLRQLQYWDTQSGRWVTAAGPRPVYVAGNERSAGLATTVTIHGGGH